MAAYVTTNIPSSSYVAPSANGNSWLAITTGGTTYKFNNVPYPDSSNELVGVGKSVYGTDSGQITVLSAVTNKRPATQAPSIVFSLAELSRTVQTRQSYGQTPSVALLRRGF